MATHSCSCLENPRDGGAWWQPTHVLAWRIPGMGEPGGLPSMGSQSQTRLKRLSSSSSLYRTRELLEAQVGQSSSGRVPPGHVAWRTPSVHMLLTRHRVNVTSAAAGGALGAGLNCRRPGRGVRDVLTCGSAVCLHRPKMSD